MEQGAVSGVTVSRPMADIFGLPQYTLDDFYPAFCAFGHALQDETYRMKFCLAARPCLVFDDHRIVHGREVYVAERGERFLRGFCTDRAEMRSPYRAIVGPRRFL